MKLQDFGLINLTLTDHTNPLWIRILVGVANFLGLYAGITLIAFCIGLGVILAWRLISG